ncbi:MAG: peptidoglycan DD-metalloendopeptidase family protein [Gemmatimonadales bacterium]
MRILSSILALAILGSRAVVAQGSGTASSPPVLPDSSGWGVHVLAMARDPQGALWVGTYGQGIFRLTLGASSWERIRSDTAAGAISWDFVNALAFGPRGQIWYGTVGNGWGLSTDRGRTWKNWTYDQLGPEWQYVVPAGIATRGDTTVIATADGLQITTDDGESWTAVGDTVGPPARGPADIALPLLANEYVLGLRATASGWLVRTQRSTQRLRHEPRGWSASAATAPHDTDAGPAVVIAGTRWAGTRCGLQPAARVRPCLSGDAPAADAPTTPRTAWLHRPIAPPGNVYLDQTYRYGSTMGGNFQQHQGVEFNNPDGTPVLAALGGTVVYAGRAEQGALTVAIRHDTTVTARDTTFRLYSIYYHNSAIKVQVGQRVRTGEAISRVGNTGRATNDHLHLELAISPTDSIGAIVDSLQRFPPYTTNPELWLRPLSGTGVVAGQVFDSAGAPVRQARIYGLAKRVPVETPFSYIETYGDKAHSHPLYGEHFALGDVPVGTYLMGTEIDGKRVLRRVTVAAGRVTWVVFRP